MARLTRLVLPGWAHHIVQGGTNGQAIALTDTDRRVWRETLREVMEAHGVSVQAYALLENRFHLLLTPADAPALSRAMQALGRRYVAHFNAAHRRSGTLWEGRFRCSPVDAQTHLLACQRYIEWQPVRLGLAAQAHDYPWSSAAHHVGSRSDPVVSDHALYWALGNTPFERQSRYAADLEAGPSEREASRIAEAVFKGWALAPAPVLDALAPLAPRPLAPRRRGRPRKAPGSAPT